MKQMINIKRIVESRSEECLIVLIKEGLMNNLMEIIENSNYLDEIAELKLIYVGKIIKILTFNSQEIMRIIIEETNFVNFIISFLNSIPKD